MTHRLPHRVGAGRRRVEPISRCTVSSDRGGSRTHDLRIKSPLLYQLSYPVDPV